MPRLLQGMGGAAAAQKKAAKAIVQLHEEEGAFSASPFVAAYLIRLLAAEGTSNKHLLLEALTVMGLMEPSFFHVSGGAGREAFQFSDGEADNPDRPEARDYACTWEVVKAGAPVYVRLLEEGEAKTKAAAVYLLGFMHHAAKLVSEPLLAALKTTKKPPELADLLISIGELHQPGGAPDVAERVAEFMKHKQAGVQAAASIAWALLGPNRPASEVRTVLEATYQVPSLKGMRHAERGWERLAVQVEAACGLVSIGELLGMLEGNTKLSKAQDLRRSLVTAMLLGPQRTGARFRRPAELNEDQRRLLGIYADLDHVYRMILGEYGVPSSEVALRRMLGSSEPGPVDVEVNVAGLATPVWCLVADTAQGHITAEQAIEWLEALNPDQRWAAWQELLPGDCPHLRQLPPTSVHDKVAGELWQRYAAVVARLGLLVGKRAEVALTERADALLAEPPRRNWDLGLMPMMCLSGLDLLYRERGEHYPERFDVLFRYYRSWRLSLDAFIFQILDGFPPERAQRAALACPIYSAGETDGHAWISFMLLTLVSRYPSEGAGAEVIAAIERYCQLEESGALARSKFIRYRFPIEEFSRFLVQVLGERSRPLLLSSIEREPASRPHMRAILEALDKKAMKAGKKATSKKRES